MTSSRLALWALSLALMAAARVAAAQSSGTPTPPPLALDPVVVTASRTAQTIDAALPDTQVITRSDIDRSGAGDIAELLRMLSAVDVSQSGGPGKLTSLFIRGGDSRHTLVLLDGVPLNKADFGAASIEHLPLDQIDRIEIVRGNLSSLYGSQAMGGVVQIFTRQGAGTSAALTAGSRATAAASAHLGRQIGDTRLALTVAHQQTDGVSAQNPATYPGADPDRNGYRNESATLNLDHTLAPGHQIGLLLMGVYARNSYDNAFATSPHPVSTHHLDTWALSSRDQITAAWLSELRVSALRERFDDPSAYTTAGRNRTTQASWSNTLALTPGQSLQLGLEAQRSSFDDTPSSGYTPRDTHSLRLGYVGEQQAFDWQLDARYDRTSDVGAATTGYAGVGYKLDARWKLIASASTSFAAPTFIDLLYADPTAPRLRPERGRSVELGVQFSTPQLRARVTLFDARIRDKVDFDPVTFYSSNIARATNRGVDVSVSAPVALGRVALEASFSDPRNADTGQRLLRRSRENVALNYTQQLGRWEWGAYLKFVGERVDTDPATLARVRNPAYTRVDFSGSTALTAHWRLRLRLENAFDNRRDEVLGYSATPRGVFVSVLYSD